MIKVAIIIPAYNEEKRIGRTLKEYCNFFSKLKKEKILDFEIIVVINNTQDQTEEIVKGFQKENKEISYLNFERGGKGFAITRGFKNALEKNCDLIGFVDADMATPPNAFYDLIKNIRDNCGVIASRDVKGARANFSLKRKITHKGFNFIVRCLFLFPYKDTQCGAKVFKKKVIEKINSELTLTNWAYDVNLLYLCKKGKFRIREHPTIWEDKEETKITNIPKVTIQMFLGVLRLRFLNSRIEPLVKQIKFLAHLVDRLINK